MRWSNHAYTRYHDLDKHEVARGYIAQAIDVLAGNTTFTVPEGTSPAAAKEMAEAIVAKARRILSNVKRRTN